MSLLLKIAIVLLIAFVVSAGSALLFSARPTPVLGVDGESLAHSISDSRTCIEEDGIWNCWLYPGTDVGYRVEVGWDGCWQATRIKVPPVSGIAPSRSGCIDIWDHLALEDVFD